MAIIYTYPVKATPNTNDLILISDSEDSNKTKQVTIGSLPGGSGSGVSSVTSANVAITVADSSTTPVLTSVAYTGGANIGHVPTGSGSSASVYLDGTGNWSTPAATAYTAGDGLDLTGTTFSTDLKANGGLVIESTELAVDLGASSITGTLAVGDGGTGVSTYAQGDLLYAETTTTLGALNVGTNAQILGVNNGATAPQWITNLVGQEVPQGNILIGNTTNAMTAIDTTAKGTIVVGNGSTTTTLAVGTDNYYLKARSGTSEGMEWAAITYPTVSLTSGVSGILPVANGGTGSSSNPAIQGSILYSNSSGVYTTATSLKYDYSMLSSLSTSTTYPSLQTSSSNATSSTAAWSTTIGAVNMYNGSSTGGATTLAIGGEDTVAQSVSRLITFYGASHLAAGLYACGYLLADRSANSVSLSNASDYRLKENVAPLASSTDKIKALNPVSYNFIGQTKVVEGFLAHEIQAQFPNAVTGEKDAVNENGEINPQLLDYTKIIPVLVGTIKELTARIEALEA